MYEQLELILSRTISSFEYQKIEEMKNNYTEEQIIEAYKQSPIKNVKYVEKVLPTIKTKPIWFDKEITKEKPSFEEWIFLIKEWKEFFDTDEEYKSWVNKQCEAFKPTKEEIKMLKENI